MPNTTVTDGIKIAEHVRADGRLTMVAYAGDKPVWAAWELPEPISGYRWQVYPLSNSPVRAALVWNAETAHAWLEHEAAHALLAAKVVAA